MAYQRWGVYNCIFNIKDINFRQPNNQDGACAASSQIAYRAKPPSVLRRDTARKTFRLKRKSWIYAITTYCR